MGAFLSMTNAAWIQTLKLWIISQTRESLLKGKTQYCWPPCASWFSTASLYIETFICLLYKTWTKNVEFNCTKPSY